MALSIVSDFSSLVLPSHRGLTPLEIIEDCLLKTQLMSALGMISHSEHLEKAQCQQLFSMLDDWNTIAQHQLKMVMATYIEPERPL